MLKVILIALFVTGFCACGKNPPDVDASYSRSPSQSSEPAGTHRFVTCKNEKSVQNVEITINGPTRLRFEIKPSQENGKVYYSTSRETYTPSSFELQDPLPSDIHNGRLLLILDSETTPGQSITVSSDVFTNSSPPAEKPAVYVQLITEDKINTLLEQTGHEKIDTPLSITWIKDFLGEDSIVFKGKLDKGLPVYNGPPLTMDEEVLDKLGQLKRKIIASWLTPADQQRTTLKYL